MRVLGFLFILALIIAGVGLYQGWFSVSTVNAGGKNEVRLGVDSDKIGSDTKAAADKIGELSAKAVDAVKSLGRKVSTDETELEGTLSSVDAASRSLTLTAGSEAFDLHVASAVAITRDGRVLDFGELRAAMIAKFVFTTAGEARRLSRIEVLG